ncbi:nitroreductase [Hoyosella rhizosphaerae]|uniref:Putative NAD(P)H nitroreductase n=1 Tax=Hoyosella rhizosphaerae TaxID=1755582 RepID=A0A916U1B3_9ACTN|nr:nitroreductase [Hoyosella rhizosphaerae]MBN4927267.1 nitroreductase [Hoyosella rhizosphaerae]GGC52624.1 nitroreductase [Hoyosella rhizosphaerae]
MNEPHVDAAEQIVTTIATRRSYLTLTDDAPSDAAIAELVQACTSVADHKALRPWRIVTLRGEARERFGAAVARHQYGDVASLTKPDEIKDAAKLAAKPLRAPLLIGIVHRAARHPSVPEWEQIATAAGVGHLLSLALFAQGWGVVWRTGPFVNMPGVAEVHGLNSNERLLGWLYVGGIDPSDAKPRNRKIDATQLITRLT